MHRGVGEASAFHELRIQPFVPRDPFPANLRRHGDNGFQMSRSAFESILQVHHARVAAVPPNKWAEAQRPLERKISGAANVPAQNPRSDFVAAPWLVWTLSSGVHAALTRASAQLSKTCLHMGFAIDFGIV